jgi:hypothetical protein
MVRFLKKSNQKNQTFVIIPEKFIKSHILQHFQRNVGIQNLVKNYEI